jgi:hypothetical protein
MLRIAEACRMPTRNGWKAAGIKKTLTLSMHSIICMSQGDQFFPKGGYGGGFK